MIPDDKPMHPALEQAVSQISEETIPQETIEAAAARVWARLATAPEQATHPIRSCADVQSLIPDFRAGRLTATTRLLVEDHLHECVACRRVFEGRAFESKVIPLPAAAAVRGHTARWAVAAGVLAASGLVTWWAVVQFLPHSGRAAVQSINGTLYAISPAGVRVLSAGEDLPDDAEIRTARDSHATIALRDGSRVELGERSGFSATQAGNDLRVHLDRGSIIVQAAHRRSGHFYVGTSDCQVAVTGTVFSVSAGVKGSRVSVIEGEVHMIREGQDRVLHPGDQASTSETLEPAPIDEDLGWSRNQALLREIASLRDSLRRLPIGPIRHSTRLAGLLPASTTFVASVPNLGSYFGEAEALFRERAAESPELREWLSAKGAAIQPVLEKLRAANEYLGDEIVIFGTSDTAAPVFLAETKRDGFAEFLKAQRIPFSAASRPGIVLFSPSAEALAVSLDSSFQSTPFYRRVEQAYQEGAGLLLCADLRRLGHGEAETGARYLIAEQKAVDHRMETRVALAFDQPRTGLAAWLAAPSPTGTLDYVSSDATFVAAFAVNSPAAIVDLTANLKGAPQSESRKELASALGGEFALALDGPVFPVPSWKLVAEVYDPTRFQAALMKLAGEYNRAAAEHDGKPLRAGQEVVGGRTYYLLAGGDSNPLTEVHYTFAAGYLIAAPTRALLTHALETKQTGINVTRSATFTALLPRDRYANFSALVYENLGTSLAPLAGFLGPKVREALGNPKPFLVTAYGEPDRITMASTGDLLGMGFSNFLSGGALGTLTEHLPFVPFPGTSRSQNPSR